MSPNDSRSLTDTPAFRALRSRVERLEAQIATDAESSHTTENSDQLLAVLYAELRAHRRLLETHLEEPPVPITERLEPDQTRRLERLAAEYDIDTPPPEPSSDDEFHL